MNDPKPCGRPFSRITPELVAQLTEEYKRAPFSIRKRERDLGLTRRSLHYHLKGGKITRGMVRETEWSLHIKSARVWAKNGHNAKAAELLRKAAEVLDPQIQ